MLRADQPAPLDGRQVLWHAALEARVNAIYYRERIAKFERWDQILRLTAAAISSGGVIAALKWFDRPALAIASGLVASLVAVLSPVLNLPERIKTAAALLPQYVKVEQRLTRLYIAGKFDLADPEAIAALDECDHIQVVEADKERTVDHDALEAAQKQVEREIGASSPA